VHLSVHPKEKWFITNLLQKNLKVKRKVLLAEWIDDIKKPGNPRAHWIGFIEGRTYGSRTSLCRHFFRSPCATRRQSWTSASMREVIIWCPSLSFDRPALSTNDALTIIIETFRHDFWATDGTSRLEHFAGTHLDASKVWASEFPEVGLIVLSKSSWERSIPEQNAGNYSKGVLPLRCHKLLLIAATWFLINLLSAVPASVQSGFATEPYKEQLPVTVKEMIKTADQDDVNAQLKLGIMQLKTDK
jgi:hypothetical protein